MANRSHSRIIFVGLFLATCVTGTPVLAEPLAISSSNIRVRAYQNSTFPNTRADDETYTDIESNQTGATVTSRRSHFVFGSDNNSPSNGNPVPIASDAPGFGETFGEGDLRTGTLKSFSHTKVDVTDMELQFLDSISVFASTSVTIGDSFSTTGSANSPFMWGANDIGSFTLNLDGDLFKSFRDGDTLPSFGRARWSVGLILTTADDKKATFRWQGGIGGFEAGEPFNIFSTATASGDACIVCEVSGPADLSGVIDPNAGPLSDSLKARFNVGGDFDWTLTLTTGAEIVNQTDETKSNYHNTLNVSYQGPTGSTTSAAVFDSFSPATPVPLPPSVVLLGVGLLSLLRGNKAGSKIEC